MRDINDIISELKNHPDLIHCEIITKGDILYDLSQKYSLELGIQSPKIDLGDILEDEWIEISDQVYNFYINSYENFGPPWRIDEDTSDLEDLDIRLKRKLKINYLME